MLRRHNLENYIFSASLSASVSFTSIINSDATAQNCFHRRNFIFLLSPRDIYMNVCACVCTRYQENKSHTFARTNLRPPRLRRMPGEAFHPTESNSRMLTSVLQLIKLYYKDGSYRHCQQQTRRPIKLKMYLSGGKMVHGAGIQHPEPREKSN